VTAGPPDLEPRLQFGLSPKPEAAALPVKKLPRGEFQPINKVRSARLGWAQILCRGEQKPKGKSSVDVE
jgi:hypothetical protein